jgi:nicotinate-nucleotide pyrophosphorylase (carboxylating)
MTVSGLKAVSKVFARVDDQLAVELFVKDGDNLPPGANIARVAGEARSILAAERVALNFLGRLSGIATLTRRYVQAMGPGPSLLDTRKTTPGWRLWEKAAVVDGGGRNHRFGLFDGILIKDNHIQAAGSIEKAIQDARQGAPHGLKVEVEVDEIRQIWPALRAEADILLLDNMSPEELKVAVKETENYFAPLAREVLLEVSGGVNLETIRAVALTGVDFISVGAITHSAPWVDVGLDWV